MIHLTVSGVKKAYGFKTVFRDLSFEWNDEICAIAGPNGSGKSTLMQCLTGLEKITAGTVRWDVDGQSLSPAEVRANIGYVAPYIQLYEELTALENLNFLLGLSRTEPHREWTNILEQFQLPKILEQPYGTLSTGQQQRVKLAAAAIRKPRILCLDEPGSNLDSHGIELVHQFVMESHQRGAMVLIASNNPDELAWCSRRVDLHPVEETLS
ncbi:MAG: ABC transporter ATP-binding protein [Balneolaceae bacterium]